MSTPSSNCNSDGSFSLEQVADFMGVGAAVSAPSRKSSVFRHQKFMESQKNRKMPDKDYSRTIADKEVEALCLMSSTQFEKAAKDAIQGTLKYILIPSSEANGIGKRTRKVRIKKQIVVNMGLERSANQWKRGRDKRFDDEEYSMDIVESKPNDVSPVVLPVEDVKWKGKDRLRVRRVQALEKNGFQT